MRWFCIYGCDQGEMTGASWVDIVQHDERKVARQKSKDEYPGDEEVIKQVASYMKQMDDPRMVRINNVGRFSRPWVEKVLKDIL